MAILNQLLSFARCKLPLVDDFTRLRRVKSSRIAIVIEVMSKDHKGRGFLSLVLIGT